MSFGGLSRCARSLKAAIKVAGYPGSCRWLLHRIAAVYLCPFAHIGLTDCIHSPPCSGRAGKAEYWTDDGAGNSFAGLAGDTEMYPYVAFSINME